MRLPFVSEDSSAKRRGLAAALLVVLEAMRVEGVVVSVELRGSPLDGPLRVGAVGPEVKRWQEYLLNAGFDLGRWGADGVFGRVTETATKAATGETVVTVELWESVLGADGYRFDGSVFGGESPDVAGVLAELLTPD